jgi:hypothetical protein
LNNDCDLKTLLKGRASMNGSHILMKADEAWISEPQFVRTIVDSLCPHSSVFFYSTWFFFALSFCFFFETHRHPHFWNLGNYLLLPTYKDTERRDSFCLCLLLYSFLKGSNLILVLTKPVYHNLNSIIHL